MKTIKKMIACALSAVLIAGLLPVSAYAKVSNSTAQEQTNIVLFGYFRDDTAENANAYFETNKAELLGIFDGSFGRSFKNYISSISYGKLNVTNLIPQYDGTKITASKLNITQSQAMADDYDTEIIDALIAANPSLASQSVDRNGDGYVDNVMLVLKTNDTYSAESGTSLVAHQGEYIGSTKVGTKKLYNYNIFGTDRVLFEETGLVAHEYLHSFGYADLYTNSGAESPVYTWSIMGGVTKYPQYPLAYERMYFTNWLNIDEISASTTLTLDTQDKADGNQAYIIKSPLNDHEIFVAEYRVKPARDYTEKDTLDYPIGGTGLIVYRVNLNVEGLSNIKGQTGIYVFRPQDGQPGYSSYENTSVNNAYLPYSGTDGKRNSIGSADMSMQLADGALTFSDGSNSGVEINDVTVSQDGKTVKCDVKIPQKEDYDLWQNLDYVNSNADDFKAVSIEKSGDDLYCVAFDNGKIVSRKRSGNAWSEFATSMSDSNVQNIRLGKVGNLLYLAYYDMDSSYAEHIKIYKYDLVSGGNWSLISDIANASAGLDLITFENELYITYLTYAESGWQSNVNLAKLSGNTLQQVGVCETASVGQPKMAVFGGNLYIAYRNANGNIINVQKYDGIKFTKVSDSSIKASYYDIIASDSLLYIAVGGSALSIVSYNGTSWQAGTPSNIQCGEPGLAFIDNNLFVLASPQSEVGNLKMYRYDNDKYTQEGESIDAPSTDITIKTINNDIYLSYILQTTYNIVVKSKTAKQLDPPTEKEVDATALTAVINQANVHLTGDYSEDTIEALRNLIGSSTEMLANNPTQKQVDSATRELLFAIYALKPILNFGVTSPNGTYNVSYNDVSSSSTSYSILSGTKISLTATANDGYTFAGWYDTVSNRVMSTVSDYTFAISANTSLKALFNKNNSATLTFANYSGWVQSMITKTTSQWAEVGSIDNILPKVPYKYGYENGRWVYDNSAVLLKLQQGINVTLIPTYDVNDDSLPTPPVATDVPVLDLYYKLDEKNNVGSFVMAAGIPKDCNVQSVGIAFYYKDAATFDPKNNFELLLNNKMTSSQFNVDNLEDIYIVNVKKLTSNYNWAARGYVAYEDQNGNQKIAYSNQINLVNRQQV